MNEVSKLGQPEEPEEVIEGRIVSPYDGPLMTDGMWDWLKQSWRESYLRAQAEREEYQGSFHYVADADGIHPTAQAYKVDRMQVFINGEWTNVSDVPDNDITYERGPSFDHYWADEIQNWKDNYPRTVTAEFDVSPELLDLLSGGTIDRDLIGVHLLAGQANERTDAPPVDPDRVKWPGGRKRP